MVCQSVLAGGGTWVLRSMTCRGLVPEASTKRHYYTHTLGWDCAFWQPNSLISTKPLEFTKRTTEPLDMCCAMLGFSLGVGGHFGRRWVRLGVGVWGNSGWIGVPSPCSLLISNKHLCLTDWSTNLFTKPLWLGFTNWSTKLFLCFTPFLCWWVTGPPHCSAV